MTTHTENEPGQQGPLGPDPESRYFFDTLRRIDMRRENGWFGGVCAGLARRVGVDPLIVRAAFLVLGIFVGLGVLAYLTAWLLIPQMTTNQSHLERALRSGGGSSVALLVLTALVALGIPLQLSVFGDTSGFGFIALILLALAGWAAWRLWSRRPSPGFYSRASSGATSATPGYDNTAEASPALASSVGRPAHTEYQPASAPVAPTRPPRRRAGAPLTLAVLGTALVVGGIVAVAIGGFTLLALVWGGLAGLATLGVAMVAIGLSGRSAVGIGLVAGLGLFIAPVAVIGGFSFGTYNDNFSYYYDTYSSPSTNGELRWTPTSEGPDEFRAGFADATLDLTEIATEDLDGYAANIDMGAGQLSVLVPENVTTSIEADIGFGDITFEDNPINDSPAATDEGYGLNRSMQVGTGSAEVALDINIGAGELDISVLNNADLEVIP